MSVHTLNTIWRQGPVWVNRIEIVDDNVSPIAPKEERLEYGCDACPVERGAFGGHVALSEEEAIERDCDIHFTLFHTNGVKRLTEETFLTYYQHVTRNWPKNHRERSNDLTRNWLERGDGVAFYQAVALDRSDLGDWKIVSFGGRDALIPTDDDETPRNLPFPVSPPTRLPDIGSDINWQYQLRAHYRRTEA